MKANSFVNPRQAFVLMSRATSSDFVDDYDSVDESSTESSNDEVNRDERITSQEGFGDLNEGKEARRLHLTR